MATGQQFKKSLASWSTKVKGQLEALARQSIQELAETVVKATPVDTGFLRGSWQPAIGAPSTSKGSADQGGVMALSELSILVSQIKIGQVIYFTNNAAYARRIEYGFVGEDSLGRYYDQKGRFYLRGSVRKWNGIVKRTAAELATA